MRGGLEGLKGVAGPLAAADSLPLRALVSVTGHAVPDDPGHSYRFPVAPGEWAGGTTRDDAVPLGRLTSSGVVPGMSGAPVVRDGDGTVIGVVSGRYNSADGWLTGTVWVARAEDLAVLLDGVAGVALARPPLGGPAELLLEVTADGVRLAGPGRAGGCRAWRGAAGAGRGSERGPPGRGPGAARAGTVAGHRGVCRWAGPVGCWASRSCPARSRMSLSGYWGGGGGAPAGPAGPGGAAGVGGAAVGGAARPGWPPAGAAPAGQRVPQGPARPRARLLAGPLRIVVAIASPDSGGGAVLDYERELRNVLAAVRAARADAADVRVVPFATLAAIRAELDLGPAHVLHVTGHGSPGKLWLEDEDGAAVTVTADELCDQAIPPGRMPPVVTLAACYTDAAAPQDGVSFAARLCQRGASAVIATEASVTDTYATRLLARVYGALAQAGDPDVVAALSQARLQVQAELEASPSPRDRLLAGRASGRRSPCWPPPARSRSSAPARPRWRRGRRGRRSPGWRHGRTGTSSGGGPSSGPGPPS